MLSYRQGNMPQLLQTLVPEISPETGQLGLLGLNIKGYGCAGVNNIAYGLVAREVECIDSGYRSTMDVKSSLAMHPIHTFGSDAQKEKYLPRLAKGGIIRCFVYLVETNHGSDRASVDTTAEDIDGRFIIKCSKTWISNTPIPPIKNKLALRISLTSSEFVDIVRVPKDPYSKALPVSNLPFRVSTMRYRLARWFHCTNTRIRARMNQFKRPIASFKLAQKKLVEAFTASTSGLLAALQVGRLRDKDILDRNACIGKYHIRRNVANLRVTNAYEDTVGAHAPILRKAMTGTQTESDIAM
ncbi:acyl-CoA dehydrogenase NM domain-like protein [Fomitiporia mediterranea MF3/22]|uniref:acyl-CoA dehydrogenase NM domain-like protein n=1 Tax=Fomitiporia mediterranea (strain MF3/22) TaxID=694068 RepID=UPI0004408592|nr:acyl-CoA dehydrogenase NM domain-like protein [Fomitiporia mediterranea MF3/22]EJC99922.1 acyl-CoA dehydrogenase NM domain-like protein [Fomitiporia mediterranea MF3/22]